MTENELLIDCLLRFNRSGVAYMIAGSMASNYWGVPRSTHDIDFVVQLTAADVPAIVREFESDFFIQQSSVMSGLRPPYQFNAIDNRSSLKVDFWVLADDPFEREMFSRRKSLTYAGVPAYMATPEDVLLHKLVWNKITPSDRQVNDAAGVWAIQGESLDRLRLECCADQLGVRTELDSIISGQIKPKLT